MGGSVSWVRVSRDTVVEVSVCLSWAVRWDTVAWVRVPPLAQLLGGTL